MYKDILKSDIIEEHLSYEEKLRWLAMCWQEKRRFWEDHIAAFHYLKGAYKKMTHSVTFYTDR